MALTANIHVGKDASIMRVMRHRASANALTTISEISAMKHVPLFALNVSRPQSVRDVLKDTTVLIAMKPVVPPVFTTLAIPSDDVLASPITTMNRIATAVVLKQL